MMHCSRERYNLYTRIQRIHTRTYGYARCRRYLYPHGEALHLGTKNYWLPFCSGVTNGICPSSEFPSTHVCVLLYPTASYINSAQFETYRRCLPLCVFANSSSRETRFYRYPLVLLQSRNPLPRYPGTGAGDVRLREITWVRLSERQQRRNPAAPCFHGDTIHLLASPMGDMTYITPCALSFERICHLRMCARIGNIDNFFFNRVSFPHYRILWTN